MATRYFGVGYGADFDTVTTDTSTTSKTVEVTVDLAVITKKQDLLLALEAIKKYIIEYTDL